MNLDNGSPASNISVMKVADFWYLNVFGVAVAREGGRCHWTGTGASNWDRENMEQAAAVMRQRCESVAKADNNLFVSLFGGFGL